MHLYSLGLAILTIPFSFYCIMRLNRAADDAERLWWRNFRMAGAYPVLVSCVYFKYKFVRCGDQMIEKYLQ